MDNVAELAQAMELWVQRAVERRVDYRPEIVPGATVYLLPPFENVAQDGPQLVVSYVNYNVNTEPRVHMVVDHYYSDGTATRSRPDYPLSVVTTVPPKQGK